MEAGIETLEAEVPTGLAVLSPELGAALLSPVPVDSGAVATGEVSPSVGVGALPYEDGREVAPGTTGDTVGAIEDCEFGTSVGFDEASGEFEEAAVGEEGSEVAAGTFVKP